MWKWTAKALAWATAISLCLAVVSGCNKGSSDSSSTDILPTKINPDSN